MSSSTSAVAHGVAGESGHVEHYDPVAGKIGMWLFLFTEVLLFGAMFIAFAMYLAMYRFEFQEGSQHLDIVAGTVNTAILLTSSLTMALSIAALSRNQKGLSIGLMVATLAFAGAFLVIKSFEWGAKFEHGLYPRSEHLAELPLGEQIFFGLYFTMTGLHALHVIIGGIAILAAMGFVATGKTRSDRITLLENVGLYWHLVDLVWIFLFPLFYLIG